MDPRNRHFGLRWPRASGVEIRAAGEERTGLGLHEQLGHVARRQPVRVGGRDRSHVGWVAFDATAPICPDDCYVRVAVGFDGQDGAMTRSAHSGGEEKVETAIRVEQAGAQSQA